MKRALITGANKSIGFEAARQLLQKGYYVYLGARDIQNGEEAVAQLKSEGLSNVEYIQLEVTDEASVKSAREEIGKRTTVLDVLINNAGISGGMPQAASTADVNTMKQVFEVNVFGVARMNHLFLDLLKQSAQPRIVNVTSGMGSLTLASDPDFRYYNLKGAYYAPSKAALNMYTIVLAYELRDTNFKVNAVDPGFTKTDFNNHRGTGTVETAAARVVKYAVIGDDGPTGQFFSEEMNSETGVIPW